MLEEVHYSLYSAYDGIDYYKHVHIFENKIKLQGQTLLVRVEIHEFHACITSLYFFSSYTFMCNP